MEPLLYSINSANAIFALLRAFYSHRPEHFLPDAVLLVWKSRSDQGRAMDYSSVGCYFNFYSGYRALVQNKEFNAEGFLDLGAYFREIGQLPDSILWFNLPTNRVYFFCARLRYRSKKNIKAQSSQ